VSEERVLPSPEAHRLFAVTTTSDAWVEAGSSKAQASARVRLGFIFFLPVGSVGGLRVREGRLTVIEASIPEELVSLACGAQASPTWRPSLGESHTKLAVAMEQMVLHHPSTSSDDTALEDRVLTRTMAHAFGDVRFRSDDGWLSPAALRRVAEVGARSGGRSDVQTLAQVAGLSVSAFSRAFRGATGLTAGSWLRMQRTRVAERLLAETDMTMHEIAEHAGLSGAGHLSQLIRSTRGVTPGSFRAASKRAPW
jgi:AraC-like DNA-binding protein